MAKQVYRDYSTSVSRYKCYRARMKAYKMLHGEYGEQYKKLRQYGHVVIQANPRSTMILKLEASLFQRLSISLDAYKKGFIHGCRPIIALDGCFLKTSFGGQLLCAMGKDGNDNMYPLAYAVCEKECKDSWGWFIDILLNDIGSVQENGWVFITDQQKGLKDILEVEGAEHKFCVRYFYANFKVAHKGKALKDTLWNAARASTKVEFEKEMKELDRISGPAANWVKERDAKGEQWSRHSFSPRAKSDILVNNIAECFNSFILEARDKPILTMLETIRRMLMNRYFAKKEGMEKYNGPICPRIQTKLEKNKKGVVHCFPYMVGDGKFEVDEVNNGRCIVDLKKRSCDCYKWDLIGIPYAHAFSCMNVLKVPAEGYIDEYYKKETFMKAYSFVLNPVPGEHSWPDTSHLGDEIQPPQYTKGVGRPKKARKKDVDKIVNPYKVIRKGTCIKCGNCGQWGHNARSVNKCIQPSTTAGKQAKRGACSGKTT